MSPLSRLRCRLVSRTTITLATVGIATAVAPVGLAVATPMAAGPAVAAVTQVLTVGAYADAHIQQATPSTNFGASTTLQADSGSGVTKRIYLKFVVSGVPADASLSVARLRMTATNSSGAVVSRQARQPQQLVRVGREVVERPGLRLAHRQQPGGRGGAGGVGPLQLCLRQRGLQRDPDAGQQHPDVLQVPARARSRRRSSSPTPRVCPRVIR